MPADPVQPITGGWAGTTVVDGQDHVHWADTPQGDIRLADTLPTPGGPLLVEAPQGTAVEAPVADPDLFPEADLDPHCHPLEGGARLAHMLRQSGQSALYLCSPSFCSKQAAGPAATLVPPSSLACLPVFGCMCQALRRLTCNLMLALRRPPCQIDMQCKTIMRQTVCTCSSLLLRPLFLQHMQAPCCRWLWILCLANASNAVALSAHTTTVQLV